MRIKKIISMAAAGMMVTLGGLLTACNGDSNSTPYNDVANLAVTSFSLLADTDVTGLDSVYFSIDLDRGVIFNADSLRKGTAIDKLVPSVKFNSSVTEAVFVMSGGTTREGEVDYKTNPTDSIDFTGNVTLRVKASDGNDGEIEKSYRIKVNVHKTDADLLEWDGIEYMTTASRLPDPKRMKTIEAAGEVVSLIEESDGTYSASKPVSIADYRWQAEKIEFPFNPDVQTLTATGESVYILDDSGCLWKGNIDMSSWNRTEETWSALIGSYGESVVGLRQAGSQTIFAQYPDQGINAGVIPDDFPTRGYSNFVTLANKWTSSPVAFFAGGITADGSYSSATWAFDGVNWVRLSDGGIPAMEGASIIPYYNYRASTAGNSMIEYKIWLLLGGRRSDGTLNRTLYISYDNGVNWEQCPEKMQLPEKIPAMAYCDNIVADLSKSANLSDGWTLVNSAPKRINWNLDGDVIRWECPYIFLFGGYGQDGTLYTTLWRGVLNRLTFVPII